MFPSPFFLATPLLPSAHKNLAIIFYDSSTLIWLLCQLSMSILPSLFSLIASMSWFHRQFLPHHLHWKLVGTTHVIFLHNVTHSSSSPYHNFLSHLTFLSKPLVIWSQLYGHSPSLCFSPSFRRYIMLKTRIKSPLSQITSTTWLDQVLIIFGFSLRCVWLKHSN